VLDEEDYPSTPGKVERSGGGGGRLTIGLLPKGKIIILKNTLNNKWRRMTQTMVPSLKGHLDQTQTIFSWTCLKRIKASLNYVVVDHLPRYLILN
jgi:hypothetical protein